jgi:hypothetical protein
MAQNSLKRRDFSQVALMERVVNSQNLGYENEKQIRMKNRCKAQGSRK